MKTMLALILALPLATQAAIFADGFEGQAQGEDTPPATWFIEGDSTLTISSIPSDTRSTQHNVSWLAADTPTVPEPETSLLLGAGMFGLGLLFRRRRSAAANHATSVENTSNGSFNKEKTQ